MTDRLGINLIKDMIAAAVVQIEANHQELTRLDSATGDGDHGTTMTRAMKTVTKAISESSETEPGKLLYSIGWAVMGVDGGSTGPLLGSLFMGMSDGMGEADELDCPGVATMFQAGLAKVQRQTKAQVGDKTMMDALVPAVAAIGRAAAEGAGIGPALAAAAEAAQAGALSTRDFKARFGRAKNLGDRTIGCQDPGATSIALIFKGFAEATG